MVKLYLEKYLTRPKNQIAAELKTMNEQTNEIGYEELSRILFWFRRVDQFDSRKSKTDPEEERILKDNRDSAWENEIAEKFSSALDTLSEEELTVCEDFRYSENVHVMRPEKKEKIVELLDSAISKMSSELGASKEKTIPLMEHHFNNIAA